MKNLIVVFLSAVVLFGSVSVLAETIRYDLTRYIEHGPINALENYIKYGPIGNILAARNDILDNRDGKVVIRDGGVHVHIDQFNEVSSFDVNLTVCSLYMGNEICAAPTYLNYVINSVKPGIIQANTPDGGVKVIRILSTDPIIMILSEGNFSLTLKFENPTVL